MSALGRESRWTIPPDLLEQVESDDVTLPPTPPVEPPIRVRFVCETRIYVFNFKRLSVY